MEGCSALRILLTCILCLTPSAFMHVSMYPNATNGKKVTGHKLCTVWADKPLVCRGVHPAPLSSLGGMDNGGRGYTYYNWSLYAMVPYLCVVTFFGPLFLHQGRSLSFVVSTDRHASSLAERLKGMLHWPISICDSEFWKGWGKLHVFLCSAQEASPKGYCQGLLEVAIRL